MRIIKLTKDHLYYKNSRSMYSDELLEPSTIHIIVNDFLYVESTTKGTVIGSFAGNCSFHVQESVADVLALIENIRI